MQRIYNETEKIIFLSYKLFSANTTAPEQFFKIMQWIFHHAPDPVNILTLYRRVFL